MQGQDDFADQLLEDAFGGDSGDAERFLEDSFKTGLVVKEKKLSKRREKKKLPKKKAKTEKKTKILKKIAAPKPFDADVPLLEGETMKWSGPHHKMSDVDGYMSFALAASLAVFCLIVAMTGAGVENPGYWNIFLVVLVMFVITIFSLSSRSAERNKMLSSIQVALAAISSLLISMTLLSVLYSQLSGQYLIKPPPGAPPDIAALANLPIASLIFTGMVLFLFVLVTSLRSEAPKQYRKSLTAAASVILLTGLAYLFDPGLLDHRHSHMLFALNLFIFFLFMFAIVLFFGLVSKKTRFVITNKRFVMIREYLGKEVWMKSLDEIEHVTARQGILGAKYGFGTVHLQTSGRSRKTRIFLFHGVPEPFTVENLIYQGISGRRRG